MINRPVNSTQVSTTLAFTLSPTPRKLIAPTSGHESQTDQRDADASREVEAERIRQIRGERARSRRCGGDARTHHREGDDERHEVDAECPMRVEGGARGLRILRHQLEIAEGGDQSHDERHHERQPYGTADLLGDLAGERVDPGAENVADDEQQQQPWPHHPMKTRFACCAGLAAGACGYGVHRVSFRAGSGHAKQEYMWLDAASTPCEIALLSRCRSAWGSRAAGSRSASAFTRGRQHTKQKPLKAKGKPVLTVIAPTCTCSSCREARPPGPLPWRGACRNSSARPAPPGETSD